MSTRVEHSYPGRGIEVEGCGLTVEVETTPPHEICLTVEHDDHSGWSGTRTAERYVSISPEDWDAIVTHVTRERERVAERA